MDPVKPSGVSLTTLKEASLRSLDTWKANGSGLVKLGIPDLDYAIGGGVAFGELVIFAARPSHGKSATGLQIIHNWTEERLPSLLISEEMSSHAIGERAVHYASDIPKKDWTRNYEDVRSQMIGHFEDRAECIVAESCRTAEVAAQQVREAVRDHGVRCVVVDYAQLLTSAVKSRYEEVTNTSICLRQVANECKVVLIALCQLNREIEGRTKFEPKLSDLRDTGQLEQDADVVVFCVWPHKIDPSADANEYKFYIAKNRNRPINAHVITSKFEPSRQRFLSTKEPLPKWEDLQEFENQELQF